MSHAHNRSAAECLAAEFVIVYRASTRNAAVHHIDCPRWRRASVHDPAHVGALRHGAGIAPCCSDHAGRLNHLGARVGAW